MSSASSRESSSDALSRIANALERATSHDELDPYSNPHELRQRDRLGRQIPRRLPFPTWLEAGLAVAEEKPSDRVRLVPRAAVAEHGHDEDGSAYALIACPCGEKPVARLDLPVKCVGCERHYYGGGTNGRAFVIYGDMDLPTAVIAGSDQPDP